MSEYLPVAIVEQILLKLSPITLLKLTLVSKSWLLFIQSDSFISLHLQHSPSSLLLCISTNTLSAQWSLTNITPSPSPTITTLQPPFPAPLSCLFRFLQSLNGLVCLIQKLFLPQQAIILWNPSIGRYLTLQIPPIEEIEALGFGFDSKNNDFKLIKLFNPDHQVELYSLNEGAWRAIDFPHRQELGLVRFSDTRCFLNGYVHWIAECSTQEGPKVLLLKFNVEKEKFRKMKLPRELVNSPISRLEVTVIEGCLSVLLYDGAPPLRGANGWCDIWMMRAYDVAESWIKIGKVHMPDGGHVFGVSTSSNVFVNWSNWSGTEFSSLHSMDPNTQKVTDIGIPGRAITACEYTGSLVLLNKT
ncbi:hypothetical protein Lal_00019046 [Lupinus albus]|uniref:Putative F-box domain, galactose oxidase/kelch, beta-propeller, kelch-type beta propeller n=1 Tax=Lupinus albus TaxID=3870 RepID=A0A6A5PLS1_LUPAL|nr:putative F-box domain, galactose oxidase/kelch, beta-propeller, kelch-type beta propeller [Lupinus albus]KAF1898925.1 hypothetical protein Lal_00019046 [Lupinus albus]